MNVGLSSGDDADDVRANRARLRAVLPAEPRWLTQVHGATVVNAAQVQPLSAPAADAAFTDEPNVVCVVSIADCMPVFIADVSGSCVAVAHAGWRGLAAGVIQATVAAVRTRLPFQTGLVAYLGPAIGPRHFEVGGEVLEAMRARLPDATHAFVAQPPDKYRANLFELGRQSLKVAGVERIYGGDDCTFSEAARFYSYRRDGTTGRHAACIWRV
jgi:YfiH family protein